MRTLDEILRSFEAATSDLRAEIKRLERCRAEEDATACALLAHFDALDIERPDISNDSRLAELLKRTRAFLDHGGTV